MLTKHNYKNLKDSDISIGEGTDIFKCCGSNPSDDPTCTDCCYDTWKDELKKVNQSYSETIEQVDQMKKKLTFVTERRNKFRTWLDELLKAEDMARNICHQLEIIATQSDKIWLNADKARSAIEILFCMIKDFYSRVDYIKKRYEELQRCIASNNDSSLVKGQGILKCLDDYLVKLEAIIKTRDEIIKLIVEAIKLSNLIRNNISTKENDNQYKPCEPGKPCNCDAEAESYYGFKAIICEWYCSFKCEEACVPCAQEGNTPTQQKQKQGITNSIKDACPPETCELEPTFEFPICNDSYKCCVEDMFKADEKSVKELSDQLKEANKKKESLQACKTSLEKAIAEVDPKARCK
jgi:hypothetical protein